MNSGKSTAFLICMLVLVLLVVLGFVFLEIREVEWETPASKAALVDPFLALERILSPGTTIKRYGDASEIDLDDASFVIIDGGDFAEIDMDSLASWIDKGGRIILHVEENQDMPVEAWWPAHRLLEDMKPSFSTETPSRPITGIVKLAGTWVTVQVDSSVSFPLFMAGEKDLTVSHGENIHMIIRKKGKGIMLACGYPYFLARTGLRDKGNLVLAEAILIPSATDRGATDLGAVWLPEPTPESAAEPAMPIPGNRILVAALAVYLVLLWMNMPRRGPVLPEPSSEFQGMRERFRAEGQFLWNQKAGAMIVRSIQSGRSIHDLKPAHLPETQTVDKNAGVAGHRKKHRGISRNDLIDIVAKTIRNETEKG